MANCYDFIMKFPPRFETEIGERGTKLSGGQRQKLILREVLLKIQTSVTR